MRWAHRSKHLSSADGKREYHQSSQWFWFFKWMAIEWPVINGQNKKKANETKPSPLKFTDWYVHIYLYISLSTSVSLVNGNNRSWLIIYESPEQRRRRRRRKQKYQWQYYSSIIVVAHTFFSRSLSSIQLLIEYSIVTCPFSRLGNTSLLHHHQMNIKICFFAYPQE